MVRIILLLIFLSIALIGKSEELNNQEKLFYSFIDLNNDKNISLDEVNQSIRIIFQLIDENRDGILNEEEIIELKNILESLSWVFGVKL